MDLNDVRREVGRINALAMHDGEAAHEAADSLWRAVLTEIADGLSGGPKAIALAREALKIKRDGFHYA